MSKKLHGSARTTEAIRQQIQDSRESIERLAIRFGIHRNTVSKWRRRQNVHDAPMGPREETSTLLTPRDEAICASFRLATQLPLDDCLYVLRFTLPHLTRSSLHRCFQRYGINQRKKAEDREQQLPYSAGSFRLDSSSIKTAEGNAQILCGTDPASKLFYSKIYAATDQNTLVDFLSKLTALAPYKIREIHTEVKDLPSFTSRAIQESRFFCRDKNIDYHFSRPSAALQTAQHIRQTFECDDQPGYHSFAEAEEHSRQFAREFHFNGRLKSLGGLTPHQYLQRLWERQPELFEHELPTTRWDS